jgi:hypothetical protein
MKRSMVVLFSGLALAGSAWLGHVVWGQTAETKEETYTITKSKLEKYVKEQVDKAVAAEREKATRDKAATDEQVFNPQNWHKLVFNQMEYVVYTGPGQVMAHHWVPPPGTPAPKSGAATPPVSPAAK